MPALESLRLHCKTLRLATIPQVVEETISLAQREDWALDAFLLHLLEQEVAGRKRRRIERLLKQAHLPVGKTLGTFKQKRLPLRLRRQIAQLQGGDFINRADNILLFGLPGTGKNPSGSRISLPMGASRLPAAVHPDLQTGWGLAAGQTRL